MKKYNLIWGGPLGLLLMFVLFSFFGNIYSSQASDAKDAALSTDVQGLIALSLTGDTVSIGNLNPGTPVCHNTATVASVTTNANDGYTLALSDAVTGSDSALLHTDASTRVVDYAGTIGTPTVWSGNGLGIGLFAADTTKEAKWGSGTTVCDASNKYAGVPETATVAHTAAGFKSGADASSWSWKINVPLSQKTGSYTGNTTFTATAVVS